MKKVLITGANRGIGFETAKQMAQLGYFVYLGSRDMNKGLEAVGALKESGLSHVDILPLDVRDVDSVIQARKVLEEQTDSLDILINNAAITGEQPQTISTYDTKRIREVFDTNYFGAIQTTQAFIPLLSKSAAPVIVNVSSEVGSLTMHTGFNRNPNWDFYAVYGSSKTALNAFTVMLANEYRNTHFRIVSVTPGYTSTGLNDFEGIKTVEEGARPIVKYATSEETFSGRFYKEEGIVPW